jgi:hypothetical protein
MGPKEKAEELVDTFRYAAKNGKPISSKQAALEYVKLRTRFKFLIFKGADLDYWQEVKKEIEAL